MVKAIIMAGGEGTRLRPLTCNRAKPMVPVLNKPVIDHTVSLLKRHGITDIIISLFYLPENIQNYFADGQEWDVSIKYSVEETPLGTAGGVKQAMGRDTCTFIVLSGDGIIDFDISKILEFHREKKSPFTIVLNRVNKPTEYGIVITNEDGTIEKFLEKPSWSEVFSDTANTGMYLIEPSVINKFIPAGKKFDFSLDLFPILQENKIPMYGYIADGYWCDVGNLTTYLEVGKDILEGLVKLDVPGLKLAPNIWGGRDVEIHPDAVIKGPILLGDFVKIKKGAEISDFSVIGDNCVIEESASVKKSIVLHSTIIGPKCELRGSIVGKRCVLEEGVSIYEGAVVSDDCRLGTGVEITAGTRVWPDKIIEQGARISSDLIWGQIAQRSLFGSQGIEGTFNVKITPEFASKLGSALGAYLGKNSSAVISRDTTSAARLIKRAFTAGLLSMGVNVFDMEIGSVPINRYSIRYLNADMGFYIQISPLTGLQLINIKIFNKHGFRISLNEEKKIENIFFRGDYPRKEAFETGRLYYPSHNIESYISNVHNYINADVLIENNWEIIADCFNGTASYTFPELLNAFGCETTVLRGQVKEFISEEDIATETRKALGNIVQMARINRKIGVIIGPHATQITIVDEMGNILRDDDIVSILCLYYLRHKDVKKINIPVTTSITLEEMIHELGGEVIRTSSKLRYPEDTTDLFIGGPSGYYPYLELMYDPMITLLRILKFLSLEKTNLYEVKERLPKNNLMNISINCNTEEKASIMRMLSSSIDHGKMELIDGIRINENDAWVLILPDATQPLIHLYGEGKTIESRDRIINEYTVKIKKYKSTL